VTDRPLKSSPLVLNGRDPAHLAGAEPTEPCAARTASVTSTPVDRRRGSAVRTVLTPTSVGATTGFMGVADIAPGEFVSEHYHPYSEEFLLVVRGELTVLVDGNAPTRLRDGEGTVVPIGVRHRIENRGMRPVFVVFHLCPLAPRPELGHVDTEPLPAPGSRPVPVHLPAATDAS
jgi:putative monooxygenase